MNDAAAAAAVVAASHRSPGYNYALLDVGGGMSGFHSMCV